MQTAGYQVAQTQQLGVRPGRLMSGAAIARLATLEPKPIVNLRRFQGVFAPHSKHRAMITPAERARGSQKEQPATDQDQRTLAAHHAAIAGFCSCNTGLLANHGDNLGPPQSGFIDEV